jgi:hypothetical protein
MAPQYLREVLLPFQQEGVRFGLHHGGRVLIADEMGVGKTLQAITLLMCYQASFPICRLLLEFFVGLLLERCWPTSSWQASVHRCHPDSGPHSLGCCQNADLDPYLLDARIAKKRNHCKI